MKKSKTTKLKCNVTGKVLFASKDYYSKKVEKAGTEEALHNTYMCREALNHLKKGYSIADTQKMLNVKYDSPLTDNDVKEIISDKGSYRLNIDNQPAISVIETHPAVKQLIKNILKANE